jgi:hypothetical protein
MASRLTSNAARFAGQAARSAVARAIVGAASAQSIGRRAARETARIASYTVPTAVVTAADAGGGVAKISIADHTRIYPVEGNIDVPDVAIAGVADVTALAYTTHYYLYYDDPTLAAVAPVVHATLDPKVAQAGYAPGRHYLGDVTTPAAGAAATSGDGPTPGGYNAGTGAKFVA